MKDKLILGCHVSMKSPDFLLGSANEAISYGANAMMFYTGAPQNTKRRDLSTLKINEFHEQLKAHQIELQNVVVHAPYIINLANSVNKSTYLLAKQFLSSEIKRAEAIGASHIILHPGSFVSATEQIGLEYIINGLNEVLHPEQKIKVALETMAGKGSELGRSFEQLATIISQVKLSHLVGVCFDTCHVHDSGYDIVNDLDQVLKKFDDIIGLEKLFVVHLNDSKNICGSQKDRHENIGYGAIGFNVLCQVLYHPLLKHAIKILETPWKNDQPPYKAEIEMLKNQKFIDFWKD